MEDFVNFEIAKKLKEKGFSCKYPFAMYDEDGVFYPLFTSCDEDEDSKCIFGNRMYYDYDDFLKDEDARIAPTISQVMKWLREECGIFILVEPDILSPEYKLTFTLRVKFYIKGEEDEGFSERYLTYRRDSYELAALAGIEYVLDNLI